MLHTKQNQNSGLPFKHVPWTDVYSPLLCALASFLLSYVCVLLCFLSLKPGTTLVPSLLCVPCLWNACEDITHISGPQTDQGRQATLFLSLIVNGGSDHRALILYPTSSLFFVSNEPISGHSLGCECSPRTRRTPPCSSSSLRLTIDFFLVSLFHCNPSRLYSVALSSPSRTHAFLHNVFFFFLVRPVRGQSRRQEAIFFLLRKVLGITRLVPL